MAETKVMVYKPRWYQNPLLLPVAVVLFGIFWLFNSKWGMSGPLSIVLLAQAVLFVLLLKRPVWAMAALFVGQLTAVNYMVGLPGGTIMSLRFLWTIMALLLVVPVLRRKEGIELGSMGRRIIIPAVIFFCWSLMTMAFNTEMASTLKELRSVATGLVILILLPAAVKNEKDLKILSIVALVTCSVSALIALQQRFTLGLPAYTLYDIYHFSEAYGRVQGLSESAVQLGFNLPIVMLPMIAMFFLKGVSSKSRKLLLLLVMLMAVALYFTFTRSGLYSLGFGLLFMIFLMKGRPKIQLIFVTVIIALGFAFFVGASSDNRYSQGFGEEGSATGRLVLWQAGLKVAMDNPVLGIGRDSFRQESLEYASTIDTELMTTQDAGTALGVYEAHNDFITVFAGFGLVALLAYLWLFWNTFRNFAEAYRRAHSRFLKGLAVGCFAALAAYVVNAATHNVMDTTELLWIMAGLSIATTKVALSQRTTKAKQIQ